MLLELLPPMRERGSGQIVNVSTIGGVVPPLRLVALPRLQGRLDAWLRSVAAETEADGVTATSIYLALADTRLSAPTHEGSPAGDEPRAGRRPDPAGDRRAAGLDHAPGGRPPALWSARSPAARWLR